MKRFIAVLVLLLAACSSEEPTLTPQASPAIRVSETTTGSPYTLLQGQTLSGSKYIYLPNLSRLRSVSWAIDGAGYDTDRSAPWSLNSKDTLYPTTRLSNGAHKIRARLRFRGGRVETTTSTFTVQNGVVTPAPTPEPEPTPDPEPGRELIFSDEFSGTSLNTDVWDYCFGWTNPDGCHNKNNSSDAVYLARNVEVSNGTLKLHAKKERVTVGGTVWEYTSGMVSSHSDYRDGGFLHNKGYMEFRAKVPCFEGSWPAIWNHSVGGKWPPEIDVMESIDSNDVAEYHYHYLEGGTGTKKAFGARTTDVNICDTWRTYAVEWTETSITWYLDGAERATFTPSNPASIADEPMYLIMNLGVGGNWPGDMTGQELNETMEIDFVRIYK